MSASFENDVEMYGAQTTFPEKLRLIVFENDVEMYGAQTSRLSVQFTGAFENDVEMYGAQTSNSRFPTAACLRMM